MFDSPIQYLLYLISERLHPVQKIHLKMCLPNRNKYLQFKNGGFSDSSSCLFSHEVHTDILLSVKARCATLTDHLPVNKSSLDWTPMVSYIFRNIVDSSCWPLLSYTTLTVHLVSCYSLLEAVQTNAVIDTISSIEEARQRYRVLGSIILISW